MTLYMTIPEVTDAEELESLQAESDGKSFNVTTKMTATTAELMQIAAQGRLLPLVVLVTDATTMALDNTYITSASIGEAGSPEPIVYFGLQAEEVRFV